MVPSPAPPPLTRRTLLAAWAALLAPAAAWAHDDGDGDDGGHGRGRGRGRGGDDRGSDDHGGGSDDERSGSGGDDDRSDGAGGGSGRGGGHDRDRDRESRDGSGQPRGVPRDIAVFYPDGWVERIAGGRYELVDDMSRLVVRRPATGEDFSRMEVLR